MHTKFLGRTLDTNTMTYRHADGSGGDLPCEVAHEALGCLAGQQGDGWEALSVIWKWKDNYAATKGAAKP